MPRLTRAQRALCLREKLHSRAMRDGQLVTGGYRAIIKPDMAILAREGVLEIFYPRKVMNFRWSEDGTSALTAFAAGDWDFRLLSMMEAA